MKLKSLFMWSLSLIVILVGSTLWASQNAESFRRYAVTQCPSSHPEYFRLEGELASLAEQIDGKACPDLKKKAGSLSDLLRSELKNISGLVQRKKNEMLDIKDTRYLSKFSSEVLQRTLGLAETIKSLSDGNQCLSKQGKVDSMGKFSRVVNEISNLLGLVAGPYGVPISIGGSVLAGALEAMKIFNESHGGFDFSKDEDKRFYAENLCLYYKFSEEADQILNVDDTLDGLNTLKNHLQGRLTLLESGCDECAQIAQVYQERVDAGSKDQKLIQNLVEKADEKYLKPVGSYTLEALQTIPWVEEQINKYLEIKNFPTTGIGPRLLRVGNLAMEEFMFDEWGPKFVSWHSSQANDEHRDFLTYIWQWRAKERVTVRWSAMWQMRRLSTEDFIKHEIGKKNYEGREKANLVSKLKKVMSLMSLPVQTLTVANEYCDFFAKIGHYDDKLQKVCDNSELNQKAQEYEKELAELTDISEPLLGKSHKYDLPAISTNQSEVGVKPLYNNWVDGLHSIMTEWDDSSLKLLNKRQ